MTARTLADVAAERIALTRNGFAPVPIVTGGKRPSETGWPDRARALLQPGAEVPAPEPDALNTGILCDGLRALDLDIDDAATAEAVRALAEHGLGGTIARVRDNSPRCLLLYRAAEGEPRKRVLVGTAGKIEALGAGQQFVAFGTHPSGASLEWEPIGPDAVARDRLPAINEAQLAGFLAAAAPLIGAEAPAGTSAPAVAARPSGPAVDLDTPSAIAAARAYLAKAAPAIEGQGGDARTLQVAFEVRDRGVSAPLALALMLEGWNARCLPPWHPDEMRAKVENAYAYAQNPEGAKAPEASFGGVVLLAPPALPGQPQQSRDPFRAPEFSEIALADRFAERHAGRLRFVAAAGVWREWTGRVWRPDATLQAQDLARQIAEEAAAECASAARVARQIASAKTIAAVERLARADRRLAATIDGWDRDPWLLNTPAGAIDLRTGAMQPHDPAQHMTKITAAAPGGECPRWLAFLDRITGGDAELLDFLQRTAGYCLTGATREHALFFAYGTGANGKGVFLNTLAALLGDYAKIAPIETFTETAGDQHPTGLAGLMGARLVVAQETEAGRRWAESRLKALTGGDPISARFMRQDYFTFVPQFKLFIAGNHQPALHAVDEAMRRRMHMIPFNVTIPTAERDTGLAERLRAEWPAILAWAITGCLAWQSQGLRTPPAVEDATGAYLAAEDALGQWIAECCTVGPREFGLSTSLFASWARWCADAKEQIGSRRAFAQAIQGRRFPPHREGHTGARGFAGIAVRAWGETNPASAALETPG